MKIGMLFYEPFNDAGGTIAWIKNTIESFKILNIEYELLYVNLFKNKNDEDVPHHYKGKSEVLPGRRYSIYNKYLSSFLKKLNDYDIIIHTNSSFHPIKAVTCYDHCENWKLIYKYIHKRGKKNVVVFHDNYWHKTNDWLSDVSDYVDLLYCGQKKYMESAISFPSKCYKFSGCYPLNFEKISKYKINKDEEISGVIPAQWIKWKNYHKILPLVSKIDNPVYLLHTGMEYHKMRRDGILQNYIQWNDVTEEEFENSTNNFYLGFLKPDDLYKLYCRSSFTIDASERGYVNYACFESMMFENISFITKPVFDSPATEIPEDAVMVFDFKEPDTFFEGVEKITKDDKFRNKIIKNAKNYVQKHDMLTVTCNFLDEVLKLVS